MSLLQHSNTPSFQMNTQRNYTTDALVLRNRQLGEKDRIVSLLSREHGKIPTVAKGARRPGSRLAAPSQQFTFAQFALAKGRNFDIITQVAIHDTFYALHTNIIATACASCATELLERALSERHPEPALFDLLMETLRSLVAGDNGEVTLRWFELRAAALLGYQPELSACVRCGREDGQGRKIDRGSQRPLQGDLFQSQGSRSSIINPQSSIRFFSFNFGGVLCEQCRSFDLAAIRIGAGTLETLKALINSSPEQRSRLRIADFMRGELARLVDGWLEHRLELRLKSRELLSEVLRPMVKDTQ